MPRHKRGQHLFSGAAMSSDIVASRDVTTGFLANRFSVVGNRFSVLLTIKIYNYIRQIILCITHYNVRTHKAVSTLICSFSRFRINEAMNIVYIYCVFIEKALLIQNRVN